jgi:pimeloyl-ACP methyl ester carboxylesterase
MKRSLAGLASLALALTFAGCANLIAPQGTQTPTPRAEKVSADLQPFYSQTVKWVDCGTGFICSAVQVPMDWANPTNGDTVAIALTMHRATDGNASKYLFTDPGGPGASGYDFVHDSYKDVFTSKLIDHYNIIGFDPRGIERSGAITCLNMKDTNQFLYGDSGFATGSAKDFAYSKQQVAKFTAACKAKSGPILKFVDTVSAAKDLDVLRAAVGSPKFNYLGFSYGTLLGNTYAALYPHRVGQMVLDGAEDPSVSRDTQSLNQLKGFDTNLSAYLANCLSQKGCPFTGSVASAKKRIRSLLLSIETKHLPTKSGRDLTIQAATTGILMALYSNDFWPHLSTGFTEAFAGHGDTLLALADAYNDRASTGDFLTNELEAFYAVSCLDEPVDGSAKDMAAQNKIVLAASATLGRYWQYGALLCSMWPYPPVKPLSSYAAKGAPTIMVVGTTNDPATPYAQAVHLAHGILKRGFLVTYNGDGHTAYGRGSNCINDTVDAFLIDNKLPAADPNC